MEKKKDMIGWGLDLHADGIDSERCLLSYSEYIEVKPNFWH